MRVAIYLESGETQVILTPENDWEDDVCTALEDGKGLSIMRGQFYECHGGWFRQGPDKDSLMIRINNEGMGQDVG